MKEIEEGLREKILLIMQAQTGVMKVASAARQLRVSRKTFYQLSRRGIAAMAAALRPRSAGRPGKARQPGEEYLLEENGRLQKENLELRRIVRIRELLHQAQVEDDKGTKKKAGKAGPGRGGRRQDAG